MPENECKYADGGTYFPPVRLDDRRLLASARKRRAKARPTRMPSKTVTGTSSAWIIAGVGDVDGDGTDDIIWHQVNGGRVNYWKIKDGEKISDADIGNTVLMGEWRIVGVGNVDK